MAAQGAAGAGFRSQPPLETGRTALGHDDGGGGIDEEGRDLLVGQIVAMGTTWRSERLTTRPVAAVPVEDRDAPSGLMPRSFASQPEPTASMTPTPVEAGSRAVSAVGRRRSHRHQVRRIDRRHLHAHAHLAGPGRAASARAHLQHVARSPKRSKTMAFIRSQGSGVRGQSLKFYERTVELANAVTARLIPDP